MRVTQRYRRWQLLRYQRIVDVTVHGDEHLREAIASQAGVLITPNHGAHYDSNALYVAADQLRTPLYFMTAWQVFSMSSGWERWLMQRLGCFSIDRESADRIAFKQSVEILQQKQHPLVIFPEGDIFHATDQVTPFRDGAAAIAMAAARRSARPILIVPCAIKFWYIDNPEPSLHKLMAQMEHHLGLPVPPTAPLRDRIYCVARHTLSLKEVEYHGVSQSGGISERTHNLAEFVLQQLESRHGVMPSAPHVPDRVQALRQKLIRELHIAIPSISPPRPANSAPREFTEDMDKLFFVMQLYSYPVGYLRGNPSIERLAETVDKLEEDILNRPLPTVHGRRRVEICFGSPLRVGPRQGDRDAVRRLTNAMRSEVQRLMERISSRGAVEPHQHFRRGRLSKWLSPIRLSLPRRERHRSHVDQSGTKQRRS